MSTSADRGRASGSIRRRSASRSSHGTSTCSPRRSSSSAFALLGHSFGAIITTWHAIHLGTAACYVISGGGDSSAKLMADVEAALEAMGEAASRSRSPGEQEQTVETPEDCAELIRIQNPFHFHGPPRRGSPRHRVRARGPPPLREVRATATSTTRPTSGRFPSRPSCSSASTTARRRRGPPASSTRAFPAASTRSCRTRAT